MKLSLLQLERSYIEALQELGEYSIQTQETRINLIEMLNQTGKNLISQKLNGEKFLQRAVELAKLLNMEEQLIVKYQTFMLYAEYLEFTKNYNQAYSLLTQLIPLTKTNQKNIIMVQIQILNHVIENGRLCKRNNVIQLNEQMLHLMDEIGLGFYLYKQFPRKFQQILLQALSFQAKIYLKQNKDREATQLFFQSFHLSEELLGINDKRTQEYKKQYENLSDKIFVNLEIQSQDDDEEDNIQSIQVTQREEKKISSFRFKNAYINNYITNVDSARAPKLAKKVDKIKIVKPILNQRIPPKFNEQEFQQVFILKNQIQRPLSSQRTTKMTSPTRCQSIVSKKNSEKVKNRVLSLQQCLVKQLESDQLSNRINDLIINRPNYEQEKKYEIVNTTRQRKTKQLASNYLIQLIPPSHSSRPQIREPSKNNILYKVDSKNFLNNPSYQKIERSSQIKITTNEIQHTMSNIKLVGSGINITSENDDDNIKQQQEDIRNYSFEEEPIKVITYQDPIISKFLEKHSMDVLIKAIDKLKAKMKYHVYYSRKKRNEIESQQNEITPGRLHPHSKNMSRSSTYGFEMMEIVEKKILENEASKIIHKLISPGNQLNWYPIHFYTKLFTNYETSKWILQNPKFRGQIFQRTQDKIQYQQLSVELIQDMLSNQKKSTTLQVIASIELLNYMRKFQVRFIIDSLAQHYKEISNYHDMMDLFNQLTNIYFIQENLQNEWKEENRQYTLYIPINNQEKSNSKNNNIYEINKANRYEENQRIEYYQDLLSKILFLVRRKNYVKTINGFKFKSETQNLQDSIQNYNNEIYKQKIERIKSYFQYKDLSIINKTKQIKQSNMQSKSQGKRMKDIKLWISEDSQQIIFNESNTLQHEEKRHTSRLKSQKQIDSNKSSEKILRQNSSEILNSKFRQQQSIKSNERISQQLDIKVELTEIFSLETQDYLQRYFPEFKLNVPPSNYYPTPSHMQKKQLIESHYFFREEYLNSKQIKLSYKPINSEDYLIQTQIVKIDNQFYFLTLTNKLKLQQIFCKYKWEDELDLQLKDLINYSIGRTGYIIDIIKLQEVLQQKLEIVNCKIQLKQDEADGTQNKKKLKLFRSNQKLYFVQESIQYIEESLKDMSQESQSQTEENQEFIKEQKRDPLIDIIFILGVIISNTYVLYDVHLMKCQLLKHVDGKLMLKEPDQPRKPKFSIRLILSHEDMNKHIARTNESTINGKDITLFPHFNSLFLVKQRQFNQKFINVKLQLISDINKLHQNIRKNCARAQLFIYKNNDRKNIIFLNSEQTEKWLHIFQIDGRIREYLFSFKAMMKKTLNGRKLHQNENRQSQSKDKIFLLIQDKLIKSKQYYIQSKIQDIGHVFVIGTVFQEMLLIKVMPIGNKSKVHIFLYQVFDEDIIKTMNQLCKQFILKPTLTYSRLQLIPITQNKIRKAYLLGNQFCNNNILIGQKSFSRVIYKQIKKIDKNFFIVTVTQIMNYFQIYFYNQVNCRRFYFTIHRSDFLIMNKYFLDSILPEQSNEVMEQFFRNWKFNEISKIHSLIIKAPETFKKRTQIYIQQIKDTKRDFKRSATSSFQSVNNLMRQSTLQLNNIQENSFEESLNKECWLFDQILLRKQKSIFEKKIWLEILNQMSINKNQICLNTFKTSLIELVYSNDRTCNFLCFIPCQEIQQSFRWQPIRLRIYEYETCKSVDIPLNVRGKQVQIQKQCNQILENYQKQKRLPCNQEIMKVNKNNDIESIKYQLLYKGVFMKHKRMFTAIYFNNDVFHICIYGSVTKIIRKMNIIQVELKIPYIRQLIALNPYEAGRRMSIIYRNNFIHASFLNL